MGKYNPSNERIKRQYFTYLKEAKRHSQATVDDVAPALARFENDTGYRDFKAFHYEQAIAFRRRLAEQQSKTTGNKLSKATMYSMLAHLKRFFQWLAGQPSFRSRIRYTDADYFNLSDRTPGLRPRTAKGSFRPLSRSSTSLRRCHAVPRSNGETVP